MRKKTISEARHSPRCRPWPLPPEMLQNQTRECRHYGAFDHIMSYTPLHIQRNAYTHACSLCSVPTFRRHRYKYSTWHIPMLKGRVSFLLVSHSYRNHPNTSQQSTCTFWEAVWMIVGVVLFNRYHFLFFVVFAKQSISTHGMARMPQGSKWHPHCFTILCGTSRSSQNGMVMGHR